MGEWVCTHRIGVIFSLGVTMMMAMVLVVMMTMMGGRGWFSIVCNWCTMFLLLGLTMFAI